MHVHTKNYRGGVLRDPVCPLGSRPPVGESVACPTRLFEARSGAGVGSSGGGVEDYAVLPGNSVELTARFGKKRGCL